jgi:hypothetical protein
LARLQRQAAESDCDPQPRLDRTAVDFPGRETGGHEGRACSPFERFGQLGLFGFDTPDDAVLVDEQRQKAVRSIVSESPPSGVRNTNGARFIRERFIRRRPRTLASAPWLR